MPLKKIVIIGGESTGKSTLCEQLAKHFHTTWVPEFARSYLQNLGKAYTQEDLIEIAKGQLASEDLALKQAKDFLFCDTDLQVIKVWSEYAYGNCHSDILNEIAQQKYDAYILTSPDLPWEPDPLREHPEPELRTYFYKQYLEIVSSSNLPFCIVEGNEGNRLQLAVEFVKGLR
ncbi:MAG: ATP-binding protein [Bacteroidetes bacterium]|nr:ATP-binding protein [Bacteroidota bacterium]